MKIQFYIDHHKQYYHGIEPHLHTDDGEFTMIYYPIPLYKQKAFSSYYAGTGLINTEALCKQVLSLPMHTEMDNEIQYYITNKVKDFFKQ